jgi:TonB family protein
MEILIYSAKVGLYWCLFYLFYQFLLRKYTYFTWNRFYLVGTLLASLLLPLLVYPESAPDVPVIYEATLQIVTIQYQPDPETFSWSRLIVAIYVAGVLLSAFIFAKRIRDLLLFIRSGEQVKLDHCTLVLTEHNRVRSFSFLKWIVINQADYESNLETILSHESAHVEQKHSLDILLVEVLKIVFWFNPVLELYKKALQEVHEFLADDTAVDKDSYAFFLLNYTLIASAAPLSNHFFKTSQIRNRIAMIYKNRSPRRVKGSYVLIITFIGIIAMGVAGFERVKDKLKVESVSLTTQLDTGSQIVEIKAADADGKHKINRAEHDKQAITYVGLASKVRQLKVLPNQLIASKPNDASGNKNTQKLKGEPADVEYQFFGGTAQATTQTFANKMALSDSPKLTIAETASATSLRPFDPSVETAQVNSKTAGIFTVVERQPQFPGGIKAMYQFLQNNIHYPQAAKDANISGRVFLSFVVSEKGEISSIAVLKGLGYGCDQEAVRVVSAFPKWEPGRQNSIPVSVRYNLPINFQLIGERVGVLKTAQPARINELDGQQDKSYTIQISPNAFTAIAKIQNPAKQ